MAARLCSKLRVNRTAMRARAKTISLPGPLPSQAPECGAGIARARRTHVGQAFVDFIEQRKLDACALQLVIVIEAGGGDQCDGTLPLLCDHFLRARLYFVPPLGEPPPR